MPPRWQGRLLDFVKDPSRTCCDTKGAVKLRLLSLSIPVFLAALLAAQQAVTQQAAAPDRQQPAKVALPIEAPDPADEFVCPMDPDVHSLTPGKCPRCGMTLVAGVPDFVEYPVTLKTEPRVLKAGAPLEFQISITNPRDGKRVTDFEIMHEKIFHFFAVSQDLSYFIHDHPVKGADSIFRLKGSLPKPGLYRLLSDFYPKGGTPQLIAKTIVVPGGPFHPQSSKLKADVGVQQGANVDVTLTMEPQMPIAGMKTLLFFKLSDADGFEPYLGAWGHMLCASEDLIDMIHNHPFLADGGPNVQFNMIFPRPGIYRVWVQFQRKGVVNTVAFNVPVIELK